MENLNKATDKRRGLSAGLIALLLGLVLIGSLSGPAPSYAATIQCGQCHSIPPKSSDIKVGSKDTTAKHFFHATSIVTGPGTYDTTTCTRCHAVPPNYHPSATHINGFVNITSTVAVPLRYNKASKTCTNACHNNRNDATWTSSGSLTCNSCHFRNGAPGKYVMSGLHRRNGFGTATSFGHFSSVIKVNGGATVTCTNCHPDHSSELGTRMPHAKGTTFEARANLSQAFQNISIIKAIGYTKGLTQGTGRCANSCHYNSIDANGNGKGLGQGYWNLSTYFKPGEVKKFGPYSSERWSGDSLKCNECHSTPGNQASFSGPNGDESQNANGRHQRHMFSYKLNPYNYQSEDRNIYCDDCHKTPSINVKRGFRNHSTWGAGGSGKISLPVQSQNARVDFHFRNNGRNKSGVLSNFSTLTQTCTNVYCHTVMTSAVWTAKACNDCHGTKDGVDTGSGAPGYVNLTAVDGGGNFIAKGYEEYSGGGGAHYTHVMKRGYPCRTCHTGGGDTAVPMASHFVNAPYVLGTHSTVRQVVRANVIVGVNPQWWFNNATSSYNRTTRSCNNVRCHFGSSQNWDCSPLH